MAQVRFPFRFGTVKAISKVLIYTQTNDTDHWPNLLEYLLITLLNRQLVELPMG
jgi:hypothetical protein